MEGCIEEMRLANERLATVFQRVQEHLLEEGRALTREKAQERMRAKLPEPQTRLEQHKKRKEEEDLPPSLAPDEELDMIGHKVRKKGGEQPGREV